MWKRVGICFLFLIVMQTAYANSEVKLVKQKINDALISTKIDAKLAEKAKVNPLKLKVTTRQGIVTLTGAVQDKKHFVEVLRLVKSTKGVKGVNIDGVKIRSVNMPITDAYITAKVEAAVLKAKVFDDESIPLVGINARTSNGAVTLSGFVKKQSSIPKLVKRVYAINGVKLVVVNLKIVSIN